ncbi:MAG: ATP synthase F1 subunit delta [Vicinamibacterales bacterium]
MSSRTAATRYAKALLDVATSDADAAAIERDLVAVTAAMRDHRELQQALTSPSVPAAGKRRIAAALADPLALTPVSRRALDLLAERDRLGELDDVLAAYRERLLARRKVQRAEVRSATPLSADAAAAIAARLSALTGTTVQVDAVVDPSLIGGVMATVGSTVYDGTVKTQLEKLRKQLVGAG